MVKLTGPGQVPPNSDDDGSPRRGFADVDNKMSSVYGFSAWGNFYDAPGVGQMITDAFELDSEEKYDNSRWKLRVDDDEVYAPGYVPLEWQKEEMDAIVEFLALKHPRNHRDYMNKPVQQGTKDAINTIFYPEDGGAQSVLLKRGPVRLRGDVRELMLFTKGFVISTIDVDSLVGLMLDKSLEKITEDEGKEEREDQSPERLSQRAHRTFKVLDEDGSGSIDRAEVRRSFDQMRMPIDESTIDDVIARFDADSDGKISLDEFQSIMAMKDAGRKKGFWGGMGNILKNAFSKDGVTRKLDVSFKLSDIKRVENVGTLPNDEAELIADPDMAQFTIALFLKGTKQALTLSCSKPGHVEAWVQAFQRGIASNIAVDDDFDDEYYREIKEAFAVFDIDGSGSITRSELKRVMKSLGQSLTRKKLDALMHQCDTDGNGEIDFEEFKNVWANFQSKPDPFELTDREKVDLASWRLRLDAKEVFSPKYSPAVWETIEMENIIAFLGLQSPHDHPDYLNQHQECTKDAIFSIFYPLSGKPRQVLLKRGTVMCGGEDRELMLFTNGFLLSRVELSALVSLLEGTNSERRENKTCEEYERLLAERFSDMDDDGSGSLDRDEMRDFFRGWGISLSEAILDGLLDTMDSDHDGTVSLDEFKAVLRGLSGQKREFWGGLGNALKNAISKNGDGLKLDVAFQISDVDRVEQVGVGQIEGTELIVDEETAPFIFVVHLNDGSDPLVVTCSKPAFAEAWADALRKCIESQPPDSGAERPSWRTSRLDWAIIGEETQVEAPTASSRDQAISWGDSGDLGIDWGE